MESKEFAGITIMEGRKEIFIEKDFKIKNGSNLEYFRFGAIYGHEICHFERNMTEPEVQSTVDSRLFLIFQNEYQRILDYDWK